MAIDFKGIGSNQNPSVKNEGNRDVARSDTGQPSENQSQAAPSSADSVQLSPEVVLLQKAESQLQSVPEVDTDRVEAIRTAIEEGRYELNHERLAARLTSLERLLGS